MRILVTGGAGFVGSGLARRFREAEPAADVVVLDNLHRRGSELNLPLFKKLGITFVHGDIRVAADLDGLPGNFDLFVEASAEPSVLAGVGGSPSYVLQTNLMGTIHCLDFARNRAPRMIFLSTSRVYSMAPLRALALDEGPTRFEISPQQSLRGVSPRGIAEDFPTTTARSLYGATKLSSEILIQEYVETYGLNAVINRCGVIAGPGQFGKVDQGVFTLWVAYHHFGRALRYTGFGGTGKQVRDLLHPADLYELMVRQNAVLEKHPGAIFNVGGGRTGSVSMQELTALCQKATGRTVEVASDATTSPVDIPLYISDNARVTGTFDWQPRQSPAAIMGDIAGWIAGNEAQLQPLFT